MLRRLLFASFAALFAGAASSATAHGKAEPVALIFVSPELPEAGELVLIRAHVSNPDRTPYAGTDVRVKVRRAKVERGSDVMFLPAKRRGDGLFERSFRPDRPGGYLITVYIEDQQASGVPYELHVAERPAPPESRAAASWRIVEASILVGSVLPLLVVLRRFLRRR